MNIPMISKIGFFSFTLFTGVGYAADELRLNEGLPVMVDSKTELNDILLKDMTVTYTYELKEIDVNKALSIKDENQSLIEENACEDEYFRDLFNKDLKVKFIYEINKTKILEVNVNKEFCRQLNNRIQVAEGLQHVSHL